MNFFGVNGSRGRMILSTVSRNIKEKGIIIKKKKNRSRWLVVSTLNFENSHK